MVASVRRDTNTCSHPARTDAIRGLPRVRRALRDQLAVRVLRAPGVKFSRGCVLGVGVALVEGTYGAGVLRFVPAAKAGGDAHMAARPGGRGEAAEWPPPPHNSCLPSPAGITRGRSRQAGPRHHGSADSRSGKRI